MFCWTKRVCNSAVCVWFGTIPVAPMFAGNFLRILLMLYLIAGRSHPQHQKLNSFVASRRCAALCRAADLWVWQQFRTFEHASLLLDGKWTFERASCVHFRLDNFDSRCSYRNISFYDEQAPLWLDPLGLIRAFWCERSWTFEQRPCPNRWVLALWGNQTR